MTSEANVELVRSGYAAFSSGDLATLKEVFADDAVWHSPGSGVLSGAKQGRDAILAFFGELMERSGGTVKVTVQDVVGGDEHTVGLHRASAQRNGVTLDQSGVLVFSIRDGQVSEVREYFEDTAVNAEFWA